MIRVAAAAMLWTAPLAAQGMASMDMPGMDTAGMKMGGMAMPHADGGTAPALDTAAPPPVPLDHYADRSYPPAAMARARRTMMREQGGQRFGQVFFNLAEMQVRRGRDGIRWDGEGWFGGDRNRLVVKSEGEGRLRGRIDAAEVQLLASRAIGPFVDLQAGVRQDIRPVPARTYATLGAEALAPYGFEVEAALFLSTRGDLLARAEGWYDQRLTQRAVLQPRIELNAAAQDVTADRIGAGLVDAEIGLRLRYELRRELAPYLGVSCQRRVGRSATLARAAGDNPGGAALAAGLRAWF